MIANYGKRVLALFLAMIMLFSTMPMQAFAEEIHDHTEEGVVVASETGETPGEPTPSEPTPSEPTPSEPTPSEPTPSEPTPSEPTPNEPTPTESGESEGLIALRAEIAAYIEKLGITPDMPDEYLLYAYGNHESYEAAQASLTKQDEFLEKGKLLSEEEQDILLAESNTKLCIRYREVVAKAYATEVLADVTVAGVKFATTSANSNVSANGTTVTATVKGTSDGCTNPTYTASTMVLYITNTTADAGAVSFNLSMTDVNSIYVGDANGKATNESLSGLDSYTKGLAAGESFTIIITTGKNTTENKLVMSNVALVKASTGFTVTVEYPSAHGSVISSAESTSVEANGITTMTIPDINAAEGVTLTANSDNFLCWVDKDNKLLSRAKAYTLNPSADTTIKAVLNGNDAHFLVNGNLVYGDLNAAVDMVETASNKTIVLMNNGTLPAGDYTIPSGVTLLIPYNDANTLCTTVPSTTDTSYSAPKVYRKLTMAEGANIIVNGAVSLSATQTASGGMSSPVGNCSFIQMNSGSSITVNNGGNLYAWGFIQGSGSVTVKSGGTVYECFQVMDWRGGDNTTGMIDNTNRVFPLSQYYIQNVEVPMTLEAGAIEKGYMSVAISYVGVQGSAVPFIGSDGMFNITSGYIVKDYDESTGRLLIDVHGNLAVKSLTISMKISIIGSATINSSKYTLPINGNMTINMHSGAVTMTQDIALQPGAKLIVGAGATCTLGSGNKIYVYDYADWTTEVAADAVGEGPSFCGTPDATYINLKYPDSATKVQGRTEDAYVEVNGTADLSAGYVYTTAGGANIRGTGTIIMQPGADTKTYQVKHTGSDNKTEKYVGIPVIAPKLQNADGTVTDTAGDTGMVVYVNVDGTWICQHTYKAGTYSETVTTPATCEAAGQKKLTCNCGEASKTETVNKLGHDVVKHNAQAPTCTEAGWEAYEACSRCDYTTKVEIGSLGHKAGADATCTTAQTCTVCGEELVKALGHTEVIDAAKEPTCTETGLTEGKHCSVCGETTVAQDTIDALGHTPGEDATCTDAQTCTVCGEELVKALGHKAGAEATCTDAQTCTVCGAELVKALGHTPGAEATCTTAQTCTRCDEELVKALGHKEVTDAAKEPTCTETGLTEGKHCSVCNEVLTAQEPVDALGHDFQWKIDKHATVLEAGIKHEECTRCNEKRNENTEIPVLKCSHAGTMESTKAVAATCTEAGNTAYWYCSACRNYYSDAAGQHEIEKDSWILPALKHSYGEATYTWINDNQEVTAKRVCKNDASHTETETVTASYAVITEAGCETVGKGVWSSKAFENSAFAVQTKEIEIPSVGHSYGEATYTWSEDNKTVTAERVCANDASHKETETAEAVYAVVKAADCETVGAGKWTSAAFANKVFAVQTKEVEIPAAGHTEVEHEAKAPTCTEKGWNAYVTCENCDYTTYEEIPAKGHGKLAFIEGHEPTCQKEGNVAHWRCLVCKMNFEDEAGETVLETVIIPADPNKHNFAEEGEVTAATCKAEGKIVYTCQNAGCEQTKVDTLPVDPDGHVWDEGVPFGNHSCNSASYMIYTCTLCQVENKVVVEEQHFRIPIAEEIPATCTEDGMTSGWKCEKCHEFWIPQEVIPALGHDWNGNIPCQSDASACTRCDVHFETRQEHLVVMDPAVPATCTEAGLTEGSHCGYCGEILVAQTVVPVTDHNWIVADMEIPATCGAAGHKEGASYCLDCNYDADPIAPLEHEWMHRDAKKATYSAIGWNAHDYCLLCNATKTTEEYENHPCEFCGENTEGYKEIPKVEIQKIATADEFMTNIGYLEMMAAQYAVEHPGTDPLALVLNYMRTGVANYTSGSWAIMAGPEDKDFLKYVQNMEDAINSAPDLDVWVNVSGLKKIVAYTRSNEINPYTQNKVPYLSGHFFGTMDMTYHNKGSQNHADVGGWVGDLTDLLSTSDEYGVPADLTLEEKIAFVRQKYLFSNNIAGSAGSFGSNDLYADLDAYYFMNELIANGYKTGDLERMMREYYGSNLTLKNRISYLLTNRLDGLSTRQDLRTAVYNAYTSNKLISTLEGTRNFNTSGNELAELRKAVCYAFADELCYHAGDYVEDLTNPRFTIFDSETKILAPGVSQQINYATNADGKQIVYYVATADVNRDDVGLWVNYYDRDPGTPENPVWKNSTVLNSAQNAQDRYGDPESPDYIENFSVIASTNAGGYSMYEDATPGGLVVMDGVEWYPQTNNAGFFAILDDGTAYMGTYDEYKSMMADGRIKEAIGGFGEFVVQNGEVTGSATYSDAPRTSVGITATGRVVIMCIDGRQAPFSSGASLQDEGYIMKEAGCVVAINLDGGGSTTFVARQPGSDELTIMNRPSDGAPRSVSTDLLIYSTAPSSTKFDHAVIESEYDYATINTPVQMTAAGVSPSGNAVDIPEGATWAVSDEAWASITEDGVFTGKRLGEVNVYLMLDGKVVGSKLMTMTNPDQVYFERAKVDAIYGSSVDLPLRARYEGKAIAINPNDVSITLSAPTAGVMDGFTFQVAESNLKTLTITAAIGETSKATINVMLYKQGENSFDFDKATGGDRNLAWHREVSNAKVEDGNIYNVVDPSKDMVTSYIFAMDMTTIPIPERIAELTYMLPNGTMEGATAWSFLLSLAQRISDMSWVKATIDFDDRFNVDYSELKILNDYFTMKELTFDEATNTLTVTMSWIKQSQVIDEATANPLCLISGFKLTPKEGVWEDVSKIDAVTSGKIGYEIYMRASGLYGFAQKPESQAVFGIYPYRNPNDTSDAGGYFRDTYAEITDEYTLVNVVKEGWVNEDGGFAYYVNGERLTGVQEIEGFYYDFGENGINVGQEKYNGVFFDEDAKVYRYSYLGVLTSGWQMINGEWYYFRPSNMAAVSGEVKVGGVYFTFEENGKLTSGEWVNTLYGRRYYYGPTYHYKGWQFIDDNMYYFKDGYMLTGYQYVHDYYAPNARIYKWHDFGEDGALKGFIPDGVYEFDGKYYYVVEGENQIGLQKVGEDYYFFLYNGTAIVNQTYYAFETYCDLPKGNYEFGPDGKMVSNGIVEKADGYYYYVDGKAGKEYGLLKIEDDYYFALMNGKLITDQLYYAWETRCDLPKGNYEFGPDGKMLQGVVEKADGYYYYINGKAGTEYGLLKIDGCYYFALMNGKLITNQVYYAWETRCDLPKGNYEFGPDGKIQNSIVEKADGYYYYTNGKAGAEYGLLKVEGDYYFALMNGKLITNQVYYAWETRCDLPMGSYEFGPDGKMLQGVVEKSDGYYYYLNGKAGREYGLIKVDGDYYCALMNGKIITNQVYNAWVSFCDLPKGNYEFGPDGKMIQGIVEKDDGLYYYLNGMPGREYGLVKIGDDYYCALTNGKLITNQTYYAWISACDLPKGNYEFGPDGKMLQGIVEKSDGYYYYFNGKAGSVYGLIEVDGEYYFALMNGKLITDQVYYAWETRCDMPKGNYEFGPDGRVLNGIVQKADGYYYYVNGRAGTEYGLFKLDGYYYFALMNGKLITNQKYEVWKGNGLLLETVYTFNEFGQIVQ